jgi:hypothetical protein
MTTTTIMTFGIDGPTMEWLLSAQAPEHPRSLAALPTETPRGCGHLVDAGLGQREPDRTSVKSAAADLTVSVARTRSLARSCCCTSTPSLVIEDH